jgi:dihydroflavonol-4-reductase
MILVTGATGFLGRHLIPQLLQAGNQVRALVRPESDLAPLAAYDIELARAGDITDFEGVRAAAEGCDIVVHAAGLFRFWGDQSDFWRTNVIGTRAVLQAVQAAGVQRFIYISTLAVVGRAAGGKPITEETPCRPQDAYQASKLGAENEVGAASEAGLPAIILRPGAYYGPGGQYAFNRLFFEEPLRGWRIQVNRGRYLTFPVYVPDVAACVVLALRQGRPGQTYNICGPSISHREANNIISELAGISRFRLPVPRLAALALAYGMTAISTITGREPFYPTNLAHYVFQDWPVSIVKARSELNFRPTPFAEGAATTLDWYKNISGS